MLAFSQNTYRSKVQLIKRLASSFSFVKWCFLIETCLFFPQATTAVTEEVITAAITRMEVEGTAAAGPAMIGGRLVLSPLNAPCQQGVINQHTAS